jgi:hypothetical protein
MPRYGGGAQTPIIMYILLICQNSQSAITNIVSALNHEMYFNKKIWFEKIANYCLQEKLNPQIPPLAFPWVRVSLNFTVDYSTTWSEHWFWLRIFPFTWLSVPILTKGCSVYLLWTHPIWLLIFAFEVGYAAGETGWQEMHTPPHLIDPSSGMSREGCLPHPQICISNRGFTRFMTVHYLCYFIDSKQWWSPQRPGHCT